MCFEKPHHLRPKDGDIVTEQSRRGRHAALPEQLSLRGRKNTAEFTHVGKSSVDISRTGMYILIEPKKSETQSGTGRKVSKKVSHENNSTGTQKAVN